MSPPTLLIAGIGNIFLGDDAFGSEVARRLLREEWPDHVRVVDFGIRSIDLVYALVDGPDVTILIDAVHRDQPPGTIYVIEPDLTAAEPTAETQFDGHTMDPVSVLRNARRMGATLDRVLLVGCEPADLGGDAGHLGCSDVVSRAIDEAVPIVHRLVREVLADLTTDPRHSSPP